MTDDSFGDVTKKDLKYISKVLEYRSRTVAVVFVQNMPDLETKWEESQIELSAKYQALADNSRIWDYYLAICCDFDEGSLDNTMRFKIENDRFCCRKVFVFNSNPRKFEASEILEDLFPKIQSPKKIEILEPSTFIPQLKASSLITKDFFIRSLEDDEVLKLADALIAQGAINE